MTLPLVVGAGLGAAAAALAVDAVVRYPARGRSVNANWVAEVSRRLPKALDEQQVEGRPTGLKGRPSPVRIVRSERINGGHAWVLDLPGQTKAADWDPTRIASALNSGAELVSVAEMHARGEGWGVLQLWPEDPLSSPIDIPWQPGERPRCCRFGTVCMGLQRSGEHVHFDIVTEVGGTAALFAGRRGSGKSEAMRLALGQMLAWGNVAPVVVDLVRNGVDYADVEPLLARPVVTRAEEALEAIQTYRGLAQSRAKSMRAQGRQKVGRYTVSTPLLPYVVDEIQAVMADRALRAEVTLFTQETRPMGGVTWAATQYPTGRNIDTTLRAQMANVWSGRLRSHVETEVVLGHTPAGMAPHLLPGGTPGMAVCDVDGPDLLVVRNWRIPTGWMAAHVAALIEGR